MVPPLQQNLCFLSESKLNIKKSLRNEQEMKTEVLAGWGRSLDMLNV